MRDTMPISLWLKWRAWWKFNGPPSGLRDDYLAADVALKSSAAIIDESQRHVSKHLPPWRRPSDYRFWVDFGEDIEPETTTYSVE